MAELTLQDLNSSRELSVKECNSILGGAIAYPKRPVSKTPGGNPKEEKPKKDKDFYPKDPRT